MPNPLISSELELISSLPKEIQQLKDEFPIPTLHAAMGWGKQPLPKGYIPEVFNVFLNGADIEDWVFIQGKSIYTNLKQLLTSDNRSLVFELDSEFRYVEIEQKQILNTLGGAVLPDPIIQEAIQAQSLEAQLQALIQVYRSNQV